MMEQRHFKVWYHANAVARGVHFNFNLRVSLEMSKNEFELLESQISVV